MPLAQRNDQPVPTSNPLAELQGKVREGYEDDSPAIRVPGSVWPAYPAALKAERLEGEVIAAFIVDTLGVVDPSSLRILKATHPLFAASVRDALPQMRFIPAEVNGVKITKLVQQRYVFSLPH
jgi:TonB family protein